MLGLRFFYERRFTETLLTLDGPFSLAVVEHFAQKSDNSRVIPKSGARFQLFIVRWAATPERNL